VLIGRFWGALQLGLYARAYQLLVMPLTQINAPISAVAVPALSRLLDQPERYREAFRQFLQVVALLTMPVVVINIGTADWIVAVVLGPQWTEAAQIFMWLGIMAFSEPVSYVTGSLFISQGRTREMFYAEVVTGVVGIGAMFVGLQWGAKGVAACFAIASLLWRAPVWYWFAGRSGPVRARDIYITVAPFAVAAVLGLGAVLAFRHWVPVSHPIVGLLIAGLIAVAVMFGALMLQPAGRGALTGLKTLLPALRGNRAAA
jgi:PST family polysaccharide transporter